MARPTAPPKSARLEEEIERICDGPAFRRAKTQTKLLRFLAREAIAGRGGELNQYLIATEGMGLTDRFDPTTDATVRVWGTRLRRMLDEHYRGPGRKSELRVRLPERSFCPRFETRGVTAARDTGAPPTLAVVEFRGLGLLGAWRHYPSVLAENLMASLVAMQSVEAFGPYTRAAYAKGTLLGGAANFILDGSVEAMRGGLRLHARLLRGSNGATFWAETFESKIRGNRLPRADLPAAARLAAVLGDDFGAIKREVLHASLGKPVEALSSKEVIMLVWRSWLTMGPRDIAAARRALRCALDGGRATPLVKAFASLNAFDTWATLPRQHPHLPPGLLRWAEEAHCEDPENAWVLLANLYACIARGDSRQAEHLVRQIDARQATTPSLRISLAYARLAYGLGRAEDALRVWRKAMRESPSPLSATYIGPAIHSLRRRCWREALGLLEQAEGCALPLYPLLLAAAHAGMGNKKAACRELSALRKNFPEFPAAGEDMYARNAHSSGWAVIRRVLAPLAPDLFPSSATKNRKLSAPTPEKKTAPRDVAAAG